MAWWSWMMLMVSAWISSPALADEERWAGEILTGQAPLGFSVRFGDDGAWLSIPAQGLVDGPLRDVQMEEAYAAFTLGLPSMPEPAWAHFSVDVDRPTGVGNGTMLQAGGAYRVVMRLLAPGEVLPGLHRPQDPQPPFPYAEREVTVRHDDVVLAGTLSIPEGPGPHPAVVLLTGSGAQDRDEELMGHRPFRVIADHLARRGVAVLRMDDRGVGGSSSPHPKLDVTLDYVDDALAAVAFLRGLPEVRADQVGLVGHSEGAIVASFAAARSADVAWVVLLAGPGVAGHELLAAQAGELARARGATPAAARALERGQRKVLGLVVKGAPDADVAAAIVAASGASGPEVERAAIASVAQLKTPWMLGLLALDPADALHQVRCPVLALNGSLDRQVPAALNLGAIRRALRKNPDATTVALPGLNHLFQTAVTGGVDEYAQIEETFAPAALDALSDWLVAHASGERAAAGR